MHDNSSPLLLGIDKGTSVTKAVLFNTDGTEVAAAQAPIHLISPRPGWQEEDPEEAWATVKSGCMGGLGCGYLGVVCIKQHRFL